MPKKELRKCGIELDHEDFVYVYPVWCPQTKKWYILIALNKNDWE
ncbi:MAG: hypothetical protein ACTSV7_14910 [Candidatus Baldrarchaeia archaeon]